MADPTPKQIADALPLEIRALRERLELTRPEVVARLAKNGVQIAKATLLNYELGHRDISIERLVELAEAYGVSAAWILERANLRAGGRHTACHCCGRA